MQAEATEYASKRSVQALFVLAALILLCLGILLWRGSTPTSYRGVNAEQISLRQHEGQVQYRHLNGSWQDIVSIATLQGLKGEDGMTGEDGKDGENGANGRDGQNGRAIELKKTSLYIQWRFVGDTTWNNLVALSDLKGTKGDKGDKGDTGNTGPTNSLAIGTVSRTACDPTANITGTAPSQTLNLGIPGLPTGGGAGDVLTKSSGDDCDVAWQDPNSTANKCSDLTNYVWIPGNHKFGTMPGFCVMKYTASALDGNTASTDYGAGNAVSNGALPWVQISQRSAKIAAQNACEGCHLISEAEWMTIATNIINQPANWSSGIVGTGHVYSGHNDGNPSNALAANFGDDTDGYYGTGGSGNNQRRTFWVSTGNGLCLNNGVQANNNCEALWDMAGNVTQWTDAWILGADQPTVAGSDNSGSSNSAWRQWTDVNKRWGALSYAIPTNMGWNSSQGLGQIYSTDDTATTSTNYAMYGFRRGGSWGNGSNTGAFSLFLSAAPTNALTDTGFRVAR